jgi:hypothetical protein
VLEFALVREVESRRVLASTVSIQSDHLRLDVFRLLQRQRSVRDLVQQSDLLTLGRDICEYNLTLIGVIDNELLKLLTVAMPVVERSVAVNE